VTTPARFAVAATCVAVALSRAAPAEAGPPYTTDDPQPVDHRHWEFYLASETDHDRDGWTGTGPHVEVNYGVIPDVQLHTIAPLAYSVRARGHAAYGVGDLELGVKYRFVAEGRWRPMIGTFPVVEVPTGSKAKGLGNGSAEVFVPFWIQKSLGDWTTYGGWGVWFDTGNADRHWWFFGWLVQRELFDRFTIGAELFHTTPEQAGGDGDTRFNLGTTFDITKSHHLMFSAGRSIVGDGLFQAYFAYQLTVGPRGEKDK
jgi:hypothetical protein